MNVVCNNQGEMQWCHFKAECGGGCLKMVRQQKNKDRTLKKGDAKLIIQEKWSKKVVKMYKEKCSWRGGVVSYLKYRRKTRAPPHRVRMRVKYIRVRKMDRTTYWGYSLSWYNLAGERAKWWDQKKKKRGKEKKGRDKNKRQTKGILHPSRYILQTSNIALGPPSGDRLWFSVTLFTGKSTQNPLGFTKCTQSTAGGKTERLEDSVYEQIVLVGQRPWAELS